MSALSSWPPTKITMALYDYDYYKISGKKIHVFVVYSQNKQMVMPSKLPARHAVAIRAGLREGLGEGLLARAYYMYVHVTKQTMFACRCVSVSSEMSNCRFWKSLLDHPMGSTNKR